MNKIVAVLTTVAGQGSTTLATQLAWTTAGDEPTLLIDLDMSGNGNAADLLRFDRENKSILPFTDSMTVITPETLLAAAIRHPKRTNLYVIPGLQVQPGPSVSVMLPRLRPVLEQLPLKYIFLDLGAPLAHPMLNLGPQQIAQIISSSAHQVFIVIKDNPPRLANSINLLRQAQFPVGELIMMNTRGGALSKRLHEQVHRHLPGVEFRISVPWNPSRAYEAEDTGQPHANSGLVKMLRINTDK